MCGLGQMLGNECFIVLYIVCLCYSWKVSHSMYVLNRDV
jgi:hypothetical protein